MPLCSVICAAESVEETDCIESNALLYQLEAADSAATLGCIIKAHKSSYNFENGLNANKSRPNSLYFTGCTVKVVALVSKAVSVYPGKT
jgi:hypothetical protein